MAKKIAHFFIAVMAGECSVIAIAFACSGQWKLAAYWLGLTVVNAVAYTF